MKLDWYPIEVRIIILASALERSKEYLDRCVRRIRGAQIELDDANLTVAKAEAQLAALQAEYLEKAK